MAPVLVLLHTVFASILEVFLICLAGFILAYRGILDKRTQKQLNRINVSLFTPSLLFSKVAFFLSPAKLKELWIIPIFFVIVTAVSMSVSYSLGRVFRLKPSQRSFGVAAAMFMNSNSLPIALMQSLVVTVPGLKWDEDDTKSAMLGRALTYLVLYSTLGMVLRWSYGVHLLSKADPEGTDDPAALDAERGPQAEDEHEGVDERSPLLRSSSGSASTSDESLATPVYGIASRSGSGSDTLHGRTPSLMLTDTEGDTKPHSYSHEQEHAHDQNNGKLTVAVVSPRPSNGRKQSHVFYSFPNTPTRSAVVLAPEVNYEDALNRRFARGSTSDSDSLESTSSDPDRERDPSALVTHRRRRPPPPPPKRSLWTRTKRSTCSFFSTLNEFMTVPLYAAFLSLIVALIPPLQHTLDVHLKPIKGALEAAGACSIPVTLVVLGAYFYVPKEEGKKPSEEEPTLVGRPGNDRRGSWMGSVKSAFSLKSITGRGKERHRDVMQENTRANAGQNARPGETRTVVIAVASRMLLTPLLLLPLMAISSQYDIPAVFDDPVFVVSNVLLISSPPALTLAQITQAASGDAFERLISRTIFWSYCIVTPPMTIVYVVIGLMFARM